MAMDFKQEKEGWQNVSSRKGKVWRMAQICWVKGGNYSTTDITK
jgi:hypothetical protein